jgi:uncharacterized membrane protein YsdA (DUF1294 family)
MPLIAWYSATTLLTLVVYAIDKNHARFGGLRVPEKVLHCLALAGGWPGALLAQRAFRHKTLKATFNFWLGASILGNIAILTALAAFT